MLGGSWPDVGVTPGRCSAGYYLLAYDSYIQGGTTSLKQKMLKIAGPSTGAGAVSLHAVTSAGGRVPLMPREVVSA